VVMGTARRPKPPASVDARPAGFMVIRVWAEPDGGGLRARIIRSLDAAGDERDLVAVSSPEALYENVREWLEDFLTTRAVNA
jgi:hypothetical protein